MKNKSDLSKHDKLEISKEAALFRTKNGLSANEPIKIKSFLLKLNVQTFFLPLEENISGMSVKTGEFRFMLINSNHSIGRQNFSIMHECYHLFIQKDFDSVICSAGEFNYQDKTEVKADWFAAFILIPEFGITEQIPGEELAKDKISIQSLLYLEHYFGCSRAALLHRLQEIGLVTESFIMSNKGNIKKNSSLYGFDIKLYEPGRENFFIGDYGIIAKELFDKDLISESHFLNLMHDIGLELDLRQLTDAPE